MAIDVILLFLCYSVGLADIQSDDLCPSNIWRSCPQREQHHKKGDDVRTSCSVTIDHSIHYCYWTHNGYVYDSTGNQFVKVQERGRSCELTLLGFANNDYSKTGWWACHVTLEDGDEKEVDSFLTVERKSNEAPRFLGITVDGSAASNPLTLSESTEKVVRCEAKDAAPAVLTSQLKMYIGHEDVRKPLDVKYSPRDGSKFGLYTTIAKVNVPDDLYVYNGWTLTCEAKHQGKTITEIRKLNVLYTPRIIGIPEVVGKSGVRMTIPVRFRANPPPTKQEIRLQFYEQSTNKHRLTLDFGHVDKTTTISLEPRIYPEFDSKTHAVLNYMIHVVVLNFSKAVTDYKYHLEISNSEGTAVEAFNLKLKGYDGPTASGFTAVFTGNAGYIIGAIVGVILLLILFLALLLRYRTRRRKLKQQDSLPIRTQPSHLSTYSRYDSVGGPPDEERPESLNLTSINADCQPKSGRVSIERSPEECNGKVDDRQIEDDVYFKQEYIRRKEEPPSLLETIVRCFVT